MTKNPKQQAIEYRLLITPKFSERRQQHVTLFQLETVRSFASFRYELSVKETIEGQLIRYSIKGLKPPHLSLPASGHAQFIREYEDLRGTYQIEIEGLDGAVNVFSIRVTQKAVELLNEPPSRFVDVIVDESLESIN